MGDLRVTDGLLGLPVPAFLAELEGPSFRRRLDFSVRSGLVLVLAFAALAIWAGRAGIVEGRSAFFWPVVLKLATNTVAWLALRRERFVLVTTSVNVFVDVLAMTWAIYLTGGALSPLFSIYAIELTVVALLSNVGTTILVSVLAILQYVGMLFFVELGVVPRTKPVLVSGEELTASYLALHVVVSAFVLGVPTFFTAAILRELRKQREALEARTHALVDASRERAQFMANVTHELRTPIHGIRGLTDLLATGIYGAVDPKQKRAHDEIRRSAETLLGLVDDLLELSRSDAGRITFDPTDVDLRELTDRIAATTRGLVGLRSLEFRVEVAPDLPIATTDRAKLTQVLLNLMANAVKFTPDEGRITFRVRHDSGTVTFEISDTGPGIADSEFEKIFEPFYQVDGTAVREHGGVGLGLALVRRLADLLGLAIRVTSVPGRGSSFFVDLPVSPRATIEAGEASLVAELV